MRDHKIIDEDYHQHVNHDRDIALSRLITHSVLRYLGDVDFILKQKLNQPIKEMNQQSLLILRMALVQMIYLNMPRYAVINEHVALAKHQGQKKLINGVLRAIDREDWQAQKYDHHHNLPRWLYAQWKELFTKEDIVTIADILLQTPPLDIALHPDIWAQTAKIANDVKGIMLCEGAVRLHQYDGFFNSDLWQSGKCWVQDIAAQLPLRIAQQKNNIKNKSLIDACAAPGGKLLQATSFGASCRAIEIQKNKLATINDNIKRTHSHADVICQDYLQYDGAPADVIILDAPCSATGTLRRHPEIKYLKSAKDSARLAIAQQEMIKKSYQLLNNNGDLILCLCALSHQESLAHLQWIKDNIPQLQQQKIIADDIPNIIGFDKKNALRDGCVVTAAHQLAKYGGMDGFFIAYFKKSI